MEVMAFYLEKSLLSPLHDKASPSFPSPIGGGMGRSEQQESWQGVAGATPVSQNVLWAKVAECF